jgi:hypothetical protein
MVRVEPGTKPTLSNSRRLAALRSETLLMVAERAVLSDNFALLRIEDTTRLCLGRRGRAFKSPCTPGTRVAHERQLMSCLVEIRGVTADRGSVDKLNFGWRQPALSLSPQPAASRDAFLDHQWVCPNSRKPYPNSANSLRAICKEPVGSEAPEIYRVQCSQQPPMFPNGAG